MPTRSQGSAVAIPQSSAESRIDVSDLLLLYLKQLGVEYVFGVPGGAIEPMYNALARSERRGGPRSVVARHETGAAFMAHGYYSNSGKLGVCCATTGPGATNLLTGVASAYENGVPMLVITAQTALNSFGKGAFQESSDTSLNTLGMFQHCTRYNTLVSHPEQFERKLYTAVMTAFQARAPVHLSIPMDVFRSKVTAARPTFDLREVMEPLQNYDENLLKQFNEHLVRSRNIVFVIGDGCSDAIGTILSAAFLLQAKIVTTPHGKGMVSPYHPLFRGVIGFSGHRSAEELLADKNVDLIVAIGSSLSEWTSGHWDDPDFMEGRLIHVESHQTNFSRSPTAILHVYGNLTLIFERTLSFLFQDKRLRKLNEERGVNFKHEEKRKQFFHMEDSEKCRDDSTPIKPQRLMYELARLFPPHTYWLADVGNSFSWSVHYLHPHDRRLSGTRKRGYGIYRSCFEFAPMGWAIGAAVGIALARKEIPVVCLTGDGSWLMNGQEVTVAAEEGLTVVYVILNDASLGMVKHGQRLNEAEQIGCLLPEVDYSLMARSMGVRAYAIRSPQDLLNLDINAIYRSRCPTVLDVRVDPEEIPPMGARLTALKSE